ncbi:hypothetical protein BC827DRAFT_1100892, partial [Russula dissimulans]
RLVSVIDFIGALLPPAHFQTLQTSMPRFWYKEQHHTFSNIFKGYSMWFNHVIKVEKGTGNMIKAASLWKFVTRGAMVMCRDNQKGVDIVLPACPTGANLSRDSITAILIQVKNDASYQDSITKELFDAMDPVQVGLFSEYGMSRPVIRLVFALASKKAAIAFPTPPGHDHHHHDKFTSFDIWCVGLSEETFKLIGED